MKHFAWKFNSTGSFVKKLFLYILVAGLCISGYLISKSYIKKQFVKKEINYTAENASEVYLVWGSLGKKEAEEKFWPPGSYFKKEMIWSKMEKRDGKFSIQFTLPAGFSMYYWLVQTKDITGREGEVWIGSGVNQTYYSNTFTYPGFFKPGYFIFLAGFLPLLILFINNRDKKITIVSKPEFKIAEYIPQFDSIRAIAVFLVIIHHWIPGISWLRNIPTGSLGVDIFFVLSGFLITKILLQGKNKIEHGGGKIKTFKNFYARRSLRIFPIYYFLLVIFWLLSNEEIKLRGIYYFTYTSNFLFFNEEYFPADLSHLWSLAVEEQFYLIWPWLIILANKKFLPYIMGLFLIIGISTNYIIDYKTWWVSIITPACFDAFAIGGLLAYISLYRHDLVTFLGKYFSWFISISLAVIVLNILGYFFIPSRTIHALLAAGLIYYCLYKKNNLIANFVLNNKWLIQMGKISYGIYLYHLFVPELFEWVIIKFKGWQIDFLFNSRVPGLIKPFYIFLQEFLLLILICRLSWILIEKPINSLKKKFV